MSNNTKIKKPTNPKKRINSTDNFCEFYLTSSVPHCETLTSQTVRFYPPRCPTVQVAVASVILCKQNLELWPPTNSPPPRPPCVFSLIIHFQFQTRLRPRQAPRDNGQTGINKTTQSVKCWFKKFHIIINKTTLSSLLIKKVFIFKIQLGHWLLAESEGAKKFSGVGETSDWSTKPPQ